MVHLLMNHVVALTLNGFLFPSPQVNIHLVLKKKINSKILIFYRKNFLPVHVRRSILNVPYAQPHCGTLVSGIAKQRSSQKR
jgi:hypothetical protein